MKSTYTQVYSAALSDGQRFYRNAVNRGEYPYLPALDYILNADPAMGYQDLGLVQIPTELIAGTKTMGRSPSLAGNFMPLMGLNTEFCTKWTDLYACQRGDEGIRDPVKCYEYLGRFYVEEGNKRVSVLKYFKAPVVAGYVTRVIPRYTEDLERRIYFDFLKFYELSGFYGLRFLHTGAYESLQTALGYAPDHVWTPEERRSFAAGYARFREVFDRVKPREAEATAGEALLFLLQMFPFEAIKAMGTEELETKLSAVWGDIALLGNPEPIELNMEPEAERERRGLSRLLGLRRAERLNVAFLFRDRPERSAWVRDMDAGRARVEERMGDRVRVRVYYTDGDGCAAALEQAVREGAELVFATATEMIEECRRVATLRRDVKLLVYALSQPYTGVRCYFPRILRPNFWPGPYFSPEVLMRMNWLCDNVEGVLPRLEDLAPERRGPVRLLGITGI